MTRKRRTAKSNSEYLSYSDKFFMESLSKRPSPFRSIFCTVMICASISAYATSDACLTKALNKLENSPVDISTVIFRLRPVPGDRGLQEIYVVDHSAQPAQELVVGRVYTIPKGTRLYHWGPDALRQWAAADFPADDPGMLSREAVSGYYVSADITDSAQ
ncbi:hypothetical protein WDW86_22580 [Bdellovibrionota bacterium FG-2]